MEPVFEYQINVTDGVEIQNLGTLKITTTNCVPSAALPFISSNGFRFLYADNPFIDTDTKQIGIPFGFSNSMLMFPANGFVEPLELALSEFSNHVNKPEPPKTIAEMAANLTRLTAEANELAARILERLSNDSKQGEGRS